jgi:hypothetical protein
MPAGEIGGSFVTSEVLYQLSYVGVLGQSTLA